MGLTIFGFNGSMALADNSQESITPVYDPGLTGYEYVAGSKSYDDIVYWSHIAENNVPGTTDSVTRTVSRTVSANVSSTKSVTIDGMVAQAGVSFEVEVGYSETRSTSLQFSIPYGRYKCEHGSQWVYTYGTERYWSSGKLQSSKNVSGSWTYSPFSRKNPDNSLDI